MLFHLYAPNLFSAPLLWPSINNFICEVIQRFYFENNIIWILEMLLLLILNCISFSHKFPRSRRRTNSRFRVGNSWYQPPPAVPLVSKSFVTASHSSSSSSSFFFKLNYWSPHGQVCAIVIYCANHELHCCTCCLSSVHTYKYIYLKRHAFIIKRWQYIADRKWRKEHRNPQKQLWKSLSLSQHPGATITPHVDANRCNIIFLIILLLIIWHHVCM